MRPETDPPESLPESLGPYRVDAWLGRGAMGEVYRAHDPQGERMVAIKRMVFEGRRRQRFRERVRREVAAMAEVRHPAVVEVYDLFEDGRAQCLVMELVAGISVDELLEHGPLDVDRVVELLRQLAEGLEAVHAQGLVHRDLKSENVVVDTAGHAKLLDFGLALDLETSEDDRLTTTGHLVGTVHAVAPESITGLPIDHRVDLFALGVLGYQMLTGSPPFEGQTVLETLQKVLLQDPAPFEKALEVPRRLEKLLLQLLSKDPADRPADARAVLDGLARIAEPETGVVRKSGWWPWRGGK